MVVSFQKEIMKWLDWIGLDFIFGVLFMIDLFPLFVFDSDRFVILV